MLGESLMDNIHFALPPCVYFYSFYDYYDHSYYNSHFSILVIITQVAFRVQGYPLRLCVGRLPVDCEAECRFYT